MPLKDLTAATRPQLTAARARIQDKTSDLLSSTMPALARVARDTGRTVADYSAAAGDRAAHLLEGNIPRLVRPASPGRRVLRFAARRPLVTLLGGAALAGVGIIIGRRLLARNSAAGRHEHEHAPEGQIGEGSYEGAEEYRERTERFLDEKGRQVSRLASEASEALDGSESEDLEKAESRGRAPARR